MSRWEIRHTSLLLVLSCGTQNQAVDRIHRLGQTKPVRCIRLVVKDSIETNMLEIQKRKVELYVRRFV